MSVMEVLDLRQAQIRLAELDRERALLARQLSALRAVSVGVAVILGAIVSGRRLGAPSRG